MPWFRDAAPDFKWDHSRAVGPDSPGVWTADEARDYYVAAAELWESIRIECGCLYQDKREALEAAGLSE